MDLLKAELARKRKATQSLKAEASASTKDGRKKYMRRGDIKRAQQEKEAKEKQARLGELDTSSPRAGLKGKDGSDSPRDPLFSMPFHEIKRRLRALGTVVTYFGETSEDRVKRLIKTELNAESGRTEDFHLGAGYEGIRNSFMQQDQGLFGDEKDEFAEFEDDDGELKNDTPRAGGGSSIEEQKEEERNDDGPGYATKTVGAPKKPKPFEELEAHKKIYKFFRNLLKDWEAVLAQRSDQAKMTAHGKNDTKTQKQCKDYIRPLFKRCKKKDLEEDIKLNLVKIIKHVQNEEFVKANDVYISMAIGNAAWPIGVTSVGIHERTGREKINSSKVAHVMNDEGQRKYLTSVKRLITFAQGKSTIEPSKKVM